MSIVYATQHKCWGHKNVEKNIYISEVFIAQTHFLPKHKFLIFQHMQEEFINVLSHKILAT